MQPGWYADPWHAGWLRWWDGAQWSPHVSPYPTAQVRPAAVGYELEQEQRLFKTAVAFVLLVGIAFGVHYLFDATRIGDEFRHHVNNGTATATFYFPPGFVDWFGFAALLVELPVMIWLRRAAITARRAGFPARRGPNWAIGGFFVPVVSFWFPYLCAVDCFAPGDPRRRLAGHWWGWFLGAQTLPGVILLVALEGRGPAVVVAIIGLVLPALATYFGLRLVQAINAAHAELAAR
jgi:hypothetical protein